MLEAIGVGIAISIITSSAESLAKKINIFHCSKKVINEIEAAYDDVIKDWTKNHGARDKAFIEDKEILRDFFNGELKSEDFSNLPKEKKEFIELFKYALAKKENAHRYLTFNIYENRFNELIKIQRQHSSSQNSLITGQFQTLGKLDEILEKLNGKVEIKYDKSNVQDEKEFFLANVISQIDTVNNYIDRSIQSSSNQSDITFNLFEQSNSLENLKDIFRVENNESQVVLIGNPGSGKSLELRRLALNLWEDEDNDLIPFYRDLRNFTVSDSIPNFFNLNKIDEYLNVVFILDGLDEIKDEQDFLSKFNNYLNNRRNTSHRYVLSCRSNIFENYKSELEKFEKYELQIFSLSQAQKMLFNLTQKEFDIKQLYEFSLKSRFIDDPFKLQILANYYNRFKKLETNQAELWEEYLKTILDNDKSDKFIKKKPQYYDLLEDSQRIALLLEVTKSMGVKETDIYKLLAQNKERTEEFINCAIVLNNQNEFLFEHKQLQEYLSALIISSLDFDRIKEVFTIDSLPVIQPNLENSMTMLLDLLEYDESKQEQLLKWISEIKPDLLFKAETDRIESFRVPVFQSFFTKNCIETKLWIDNTTSVSTKGIARFADCKENYDFLMKIILDGDEHFRVRTSALDILENFKPTNIERTKNDLFNLLKPNCDNAYEGLNSSVIELFHKWELVEDFPGIVSEVIDLFRDDDNPRFASKILDLIYSDISNIEKYQDYIEKELEFEFGNIERKKSDGVIRGISWKLERIILDILVSDLFLNYLKTTLLKPSYNKNYSDNFESNIINKLLEIKTVDAKKIDDFFISYFESINEEHFYYRNPVFKLIKELEIASTLFKSLFNGEYFKINYRILAQLIVLDNSSVSFFRDKIEELEGLDSELEIFRNNVNAFSNSNKNLVSEIEKIIIENNFTLNYSLIDIASPVELKKQYNDQVQKDIEQIFEVGPLLRGCEELLSEYENSSITRDEFYNLNLRKDKRGNNIAWLYGYEPLHIKVVSSLIRNKDLPTVTLNDCENYLNDPFYYFIFICQEVKSISENDNLNINFMNINALLQDKINGLLPEIKTKDLTEILDNSNIQIRSHDLVKHFNTIQEIHTLLINEKLTLSVSDTFILDTLIYFDFNNFNNDLVSFKKLLSIVENQQKINKVISENLKTKLFLPVFLKHAFYALEQNISNSFPTIKRCMLSNEDLIFYNSLLKTYISKNGNAILLEMIKDINTKLCWAAITLLLEKKDEKDECIKVAEAYLNSGAKKYLKDVTRVLFETNQPSIIEYIANSPEDRIALVNGLKTNNFEDYSVLPKTLGLDVFTMLFNEIYKEELQGRFDFHYSHTFFVNYVINVIKESMNKKDTYRELTALFQSLKEEAEKSSSDKKLFYINTIIIDLENTYINSLSKGMSFDEAFEFVNQVIRR